MQTTPSPISLRRVAAAWWPLTISWMLMAAEPSALAAVVARLADPQIHLAAYGSVSFPLIGILQAPILTLLSLSTAMSRDWDSFQKGRRLLFYLGGTLTVLYALLTFTPLFDLLVIQVLGTPPEVLEPARLSMMVGLPWSFAVAYRRFHQGVMIRFEHTRAITLGTIFRFTADALAIALIVLLENTPYRIPGAAAASLMMVVGVTTEAVYVGWRVRPILANELRPAPPQSPAVSMREMLLFFIPLGLTPLLNQLIRPIGSAALSRLPNPLEILAVWPVISSFSFLIVTPGAALSEVVIALLDRPGAKETLRRFVQLIMAVQALAFVLIAFTPLAHNWFFYISGLPANLAEQAALAFDFLLPAALFSPLSSWFSGLILHSRKSRPVTEAMAVYLAAYTIALWVGVTFFSTAGVRIAVIAAMLASTLQIAWLYMRSRVYA